MISSCRWPRTPSNDVPLIAFAALCLFGLGDRRLHPLLWPTFPVSYLSKLYAVGVINERRRVMYHHRAKMEVLVCNGS